MMLTELVRSVEEKKAQLDRLRPRGGLANLEHSHDLELTYTSNAIEGNTLTAAETMLVVEQGITVAGKPFKDHLEAIDHYDAIRYVREIARRPAPITELDVRNLHRLVLLRSRPGHRGPLRRTRPLRSTVSGASWLSVARRNTCAHGDYARWLSGAPDTPQTAFDAHRRLVDIIRSTMATGAPRGC